MHSYHCGTKFGPKKLVTSVPHQRRVSTLSLLRCPETPSTFHQRAHQTLSIITMCVRNPDGSPCRSIAENAAPTPSGFAEIVSDDAREGERVACQLAVFSGKLPSMEA